MTNAAHLPYRPCAGVLLTNAEGLIFTGERIDTPGAWQMPQGGIDAGESAEQAALRELTEEISVPADAVIIIGKTADWITYDLPPHLIGKAFKGKYRGQKQMWFHLRLDGPDSLINIATKQPEFARWRWSSPAEVLDNIVSFKRNVYAQVLAELIV